MKKVTITINTVNSAFGEHPEEEVRRILQEEVVLISQSSIKIHDINGNVVGRIEIK